VTEQEAALVITRFLRRVVARRAYDHLLTHGPVWRNTTVFREHSLTAMLGFVDNFPHQSFSKRKLDPLAIVFYGRDTIPGILFSILLDLRSTPRDVRSKMLSLRLPDHLNRIINGLYRPEIKVPKHLITGHFKHTTLSPSKTPAKL
jgi:hypothetical protein